MFELSFYISLLLTITMDIQRKDFWEMFVHHIATISLMLLSYTGNFVRIGSLILLLHDISDIFLEGAKLTNYVLDGASVICDVLFGLFALVFGTTRLFYFPFFVLWTISFDSFEVFGAESSALWTGRRIFMVFLYTLQALHCFWYGSPLPTFPRRAPCPLSPLL
jgi:ceramide synthetase